MILFLSLVILIKFTSFGRVIGIRRKIVPQMYAEQTNIGELIRSGKLSNEIQSENDAA